MIYLRLLPPLLVYMICLAPAARGEDLARRYAGQGELIPVEEITRRLKIIKL